MFLQRSEAAKAFQLVRESTRGNVATVFWATGTLDGNSQTIKIPVDSVTKRITFTLSVDTKGTALKLTQPSGGVILEGSASTEITELNCGRIVTLISPESGEWTAQLTGKGRYWLEAQAQSDIYFVSAEFVKQGGRPGHEGLFRIQGQPLLGIPATLQATLSPNSTKTTDFYLVSERGEMIQKVALRALNADRQFLEFGGSVDLPTVPFRLAVRGTDSSGKPFQRFFAGLFHAESVAITAKIDFDELPAGRTSQVSFAVQNTGAARTFKLTVTDAQHFLSRVEPQEMVLGAGESATVRVDLTVPVSATSGAEDDLVIVAASISGPPTSNSSVVRLSVSSGAGREVR
jgi:von Willebrand factor A domain-containing protein 7